MVKYAEAPADVVPLLRDTYGAQQKSKQADKEFNALKDRCREELKKRKALFVVGAGIYASVSITPGSSEPSVQWEQVVKQLPLQLELSLEQQKKLRDLIVTCTKTVVKKEGSRFDIGKTPYHKED